MALVSSDDKEKDTQLYSMWILSSIKGNKGNARGLMFADLEVAERNMGVLVDTGVSMLFIFKKAA